MESRYFYRNHDASWSLFADEYSGFSESSGLLADIAPVLGEVCWVFSQVFSDETIQAHPILSVLHCEDGPVTYRGNMLIFLSSRGRYYMNHIYQFAHELCHFMVSGDVCQNYRWFGETLCQMMSWYAMDRIYKSRSVRNLQQLSPLYEKMPGYIKNDMAVRDDLPEGSVAEYIQRNLAHLRNECEDRRKNRTIAYGIYPIFCDHPELWKIVPFLDQLKPDAALADALRTLFRLAVTPSDVGDLLTQRLCDQPFVPPQ